MQSGPAGGVGNSRGPAGTGRRRGKLMDKAILLAVAASVCTATASLCQRKGAKDNETAGFDALAAGPLAASQPGFTILGPAGGQPAWGVLVRRAHPDRAGRPGRRGAGRFVSNTGNADRPGR